MKKKEILKRIVAIAAVLLTFTSFSCRLESAPEGKIAEVESGINKAGTSGMESFSAGQFVLTVVDNIQYYGLTGGKTFGSYVMAGLQTMNNSDPVMPEVQSWDYSCRFKIREEKSKDDETSHGTEDLGILEVNTGNTSGILYDYRHNIIGEVAVARDVWTADNNDMKIVTLGSGHKYKDPVVIAMEIEGPANDTCVIDIVDIANFGPVTSAVYYTVKEWDYINNSHYSNKILFLVIEKGAHCIALKNNVYYVLEAGEKMLTQPAGRGSSQEQIDLLTDFERKPFIFGNMQINNAANPTGIVRIAGKNIEGTNADSFKVQLQYSEAKTDGSGNGNAFGELYGYIAIGRVGQKHTTRKGLVSQGGFLEVKNNRLVSQNGDQIQLKGMSAFWTNWEEGRKYANPETIEWLVRDWDMDVYRLAIGVNPYDGRDVVLFDDDGNFIDMPYEDRAPFENHGQPCQPQGFCYKKYPEGVTDMVHELVQACIDRGIYIILDWHIHDAFLSEDDAVDFFGEMARTYGNTPNVIFEIWNEPSMKNNDTWAAKHDADGSYNYDKFSDYIYNWEDDIKPYCERMIKVIQDTGAKNIIICPTPCYDQNIWDVVDNPIVLSSPDKQKRIMYSLHFYSGTTEDWSKKATGDEWTYKMHTPSTKFGHNMFRYVYTFWEFESHSLPVFISEWGTSEFDGGQNPSSVFLWSEATAWIAAVNARYMSWCNWSISDKDEDASAMKPGACPIGYWSRTALTQSGWLVRYNMKNGH